MNLTSLRIALGFLSCLVVTLQIWAAPVIIAQPANQLIPATETATFKVGAAGAGLISCQWQISRSDSAPFVDLTNSATFAEADSSALTITAASGDLDGARFHRAVATADSSVIVRQDYPTGGVTFWRMNGTALQSVRTVFSNFPVVGSFAIEAIAADSDR